MKSMLPFWVVFALPAMVCAATWYVVPSGSDAWNGTNWPTAKATIQAAVDASSPGDTVWVSNGLYATGGRIAYGALTNRLVVDKAITVRSLNGPAVTTIRGESPNGDSAVRCVSLVDGATLIGFTLTNGHTLAIGDDRYERSGGGVWCESTAAIVSNCTLSGNAAAGFGGGSCDGTLRGCTLSWNRADTGGGAYGGSLNNCTLSDNLASADGGGACNATLNNCALNGNDATHDGGGAYDSTLYYCALRGNSAMHYGGGTCNGGVNTSTFSSNSALACGGGSYAGILNNCVLWANSAQRGGGSSGGMLYNCTLSDNRASLGAGGSDGSLVGNCIAYYNSGLATNDIGGGSVSYSCASLNPGGSGNMTNEPSFENRTAGNFHLLVTSPCIDGGDNGSAPGNEDLDGNTRIINSIVDMGAYEYRWTNPCAVSIDVTPDQGPWVMSAFAPGYSGQTNGTGDMPFTNAPAGTYTVRYLELLPYWTPVSQTIAVAPRHVVTFAATYSGNYKRPQVTWTAVPGATWYNLWINRSGTNYLKKWLNQTTTSWTADTDFQSGNYTWRVSGWSPATGSGPWSTDRYFTVSLKTPGRLTAFAPTGTVTTNRPQFGWSANTYATQYYLWINKSGSTYSKLSCAVTSTVLDAAIGFGSYEWWVRGSSPDGYGPWSTARSFRYGYAELVSPMGTIRGTREPVFRWKQVADATWYQIVLNRNGEKYDSQWISGSANTNWAPGEGLPGGNYRWWVQTWNPTTAVWSMPLDCVVPTAVPGVIKTVSPGGTSAGTVQNYTWRGDGTSTWYNVWINRNGTKWRSQWYETGITTGNVVRSISGHPTASTYHWGVRGWTPDGTGPWSTARTFTTP